MRADVPGQPVPPDGLVPGRGPGVKAAAQPLVDAGDLIRAKCLLENWRSAGQATAGSSWTRCGVSLM